MLRLLCVKGVGKHRNSILYRTVTSTVLKYDTFYRPCSQSLPPFIHHLLQNITKNEIKRIHSYTPLSLCLPYSTGREQKTNVHRVWQQSWRRRDAAKPERAWRLTARQVKSSTWGADGLPKRSLADSETKRTENSGCPGNDGNRIVVLTDKTVSSRTTQSRKRGRPCQGGEELSGRARRRHAATGGSGTVLYFRFPFQEQICGSREASAVRGTCFTELLIRNRKKLHAFRFDITHTAENKIYWIHGAEKLKSLSSSSHFPYSRECED